GFSTDWLPRTGDFRGRGNLLLIVETLQVRCVAPAQNSVSIYGQPWFAFFSFCFLRYLLRGFRFSFRRSFQRRVVRQRLWSGVWQENNLLVFSRQRSGTR